MDARPHGAVSAEPTREGSRGVSGSYEAAQQSPATRRRRPAGSRRRSGTWLMVLIVLASLAVFAIGIYHYATAHITPRFDVLLAVLAIAYRVISQLMLVASQRSGRTVSWKHLHFPWVLRTMFAWTAAVYMAGYVYYTVKVYKLVLSWVPARGIDHLRSGLHVGWLAMAIGVVLWAVWLTIALEAIRLVLLYVFGVSVEQEAQSMLPNFLAIHVARAEDAYQITLTLWFVSLSFYRTVS